MVVLLSLHSLLVSHRIVGPLYRFKKVFRSLGGGHFDMRIRLRSGDYLSKEADAINEMIEAVSAKLSALADARDGKRAEQLVTRLESELAVLDGRLDAFRTIKAASLRSEDQQPRSTAVEQREPGLANRP
ncbi:MAG: hypothetical protein JSV80_05000 [Acidobacteriota bacterium]|nr:MAG: hypothetical protein JSV80_05000 [Acidobacteriota bacterium]